MKEARFSIDQIPDLSSQVALVTGGNRGIGLETVRQLCLHGAKVFMACRDRRGSLDWIQSFKSSHPGAEVEFIHLDLADLESVSACSQEVVRRTDRLDILINNAGVMACPFEITKDGVEIQFQVNHLGHFLLFKKLSELLDSTGKVREGVGLGPSRVVNLSSLGHHFISLNPLTSPNFDSLPSVNRRMGAWLLGDYTRYSQSKLCNILFSRASNRLHPERSFRSLSVHPGLVSTDLYRHSGLWVRENLISRLFIQPLQGSISTLKAATDPSIHLGSEWDVYRGTYGLVNLQSRDSKDLRLEDDLWRLSEALVRPFL
ncbi:NAD(P)-binding protein [Violaceomyces palustris]|uniref:NAD(P)-binding protein n=1 Tax=Violaceomyces palustris TaxID=1673888 RepID=A0ACD0NUD0_9BASI|nr:NAD(P)-binding protein [Violaceomyces palustris]